MTSSPLDKIEFRNAQGKPVSLGEYKGKVLLIVNVASQCGLTPQYEGLEKLYEKYREQGLVVLGFPANEFGAQEPGSNAEIQEFCKMNYAIQFPVFEKIVVKGQGQHPLYQKLTSTKPTSVKKMGSSLEKTLKEHGLLSGAPADIMWNFEKFLVNREGEVVERFAPDVAPDDTQLVEAIEAELTS